VDRSLRIGRNGEVAPAHSKRARVPADRHQNGFERALQPFHEALRPFGRRCRRDDGELGASEMSDDIRGPSRPRESNAEMLADPFRERVD
jgi:hypothetical protein